MGDERSEQSRRAFLRTSGAYSALGLGGTTVAQFDDWGDQLVEESKTFAEIVRETPGLGYSGESVDLSAAVGGETVLEAAGDEAGYWVGAPSLTPDPAGEKPLLHLRHRHPEKRGYRVTLSRFDPDAMAVEDELIAVEKGELNARSMEGGELLVRDGEYRWFVSYQHDDAGDWRLHERRAATVDGLASGGRDVPLDSAYTHQKDPAFVDGSMYVVSSSENWFEVVPERFDVDAETPTTEALPVSGVDNARVTTGGVVGSEVFADTWPDFPLTDASNVLWTTDERSATGGLDSGAVAMDGSRHFVSASGGSVTYVEAARFGDSVVLLWQGERADESKALRGARIGVDEYERLV